ncbi:MAG: L,D-transpeptidase family protein [Methyloceanibacter sp.]|jgi:peptidoglycan hydrolase-like protein with peptidoglycan-binding domain
MRIARLHTLALHTLALLFATALPLSATASEGLFSPTVTAPEEFGLEPHWIELVSTGSRAAIDATASQGETSDTASVYEEALDRLAVVRPTLPYEVEEEREDFRTLEPIAYINVQQKTLLPASTALSSRSVVRTSPIELTAPALKKSQLVARLMTEPLNEMVVRDELKSSRSGELLEPRNILATQINGKVIAQPVTVIISLKDQQLDVYRGLERVETTRISSGKPGYQTLTGVFGILQKKPEHYSNLYDNAPMPWMQRLTRTGTALHAGEVPNRPASHGCIRMNHDFAPKLFRMTKIGGKVATLTGSMVEPKLIENNTLVMPRSIADLGEMAEKSIKAGVRESALAAAGSPSAKVSSQASVGARDERPWHMLVTRREQRDIAIGVQEALAAMGYLEPQDKFVGYIGASTQKAIRAFEKDHGLRPRGVFNERIATKIYEEAGKGPLPDAYLFLRRGFSQVRNVPVQLRDPEKPLGTHLFTYGYSAERGEPGWVGISLEGEDSEKVLDRITIPDAMRDEIAKGLTSGASFIVADVAKHSSVLPEGDDFIVRTNDSAKSVGVAKRPTARKRKRASTRRAAPPKKRVVRAQPQRKKVRRTVSGPRGFGPFRRR